MHSVLSTRELSTAIWTIIILIMCLFSSKMRKPLIGVVKAACTHKLVIPFVCMLAYAALFVCIISRLQIWKWNYIKDIAIWLVFAGIFECYGIVGNSNIGHYFRDIIIGNLKLSAILEFLIGTYTFSICVEILLVPCVMILPLIAVYPGARDSNESAKRLALRLVNLIIASLVVFSIISAVQEFREERMIDLFIGLSLPIILSTIYAPIAYCIAIYAKYESLFIRMGFKEPDDKMIRWKHRISVIRLCGASYSRIVQFEKDYVKHMYVSMSEDSFNDLIRKATFNR